MELTAWLFFATISLGLMVLVSLAGAARGGAGAYGNTGAITALSPNGKDMLMADAPDVLTGWKMIAQFLNVSESTASLYAKEHGMPVHQPTGRTVFALREELARWLTSGLVPFFPELPRTSPNFPELR